MRSNSWSDLVNKNQIAGFLDSNLRGASQVFLQDNPISGLIILVAIFWGAHSAGNIATGFGAVSGLIISTSAAYLLRVDRVKLKQGLFGFNGVLVGVAVPTFLANNPAMWANLAVGSAVSTVVALALENAVKNWGISGSTAPFVLTTQILLLAAYGFGRISILSPSGAALPIALTSAGSWPADLPAALARCISEVYLIGNVVTGILFLLAIAINSRIGALFAVLGAVVSLIGAVGFGANGDAIDAGLYGYSAVLTAIAIGTVLNKTSVRVTLYALLATVFTVIVQAALNTAMAPIGIPALTAPYVLTMWLFQLPGLNLAPNLDGS